MEGSLVRSFFSLITAKAGTIWFIHLSPNEIWIEEAISPKERKFIILHELHERHLMSLGKSYKNAHIRRHRSGRPLSGKPQRRFRGENKRGDEEK